jgi:hypothetical protein
LKYRHAVRHICNPADPLEVIEELTSFVVGGLQAGAAQ